MKKITVTDFIDTKYRDFFREDNEHRNACLPYEQLLRIERHIVAAADRINFTNPKDELKLITLGGEVLKGHTSGDASVYDTIKMSAQEYKRQPAVRIIKGIGNVGLNQGDPGAAARYLSVSPTPLLRAMCSDLKYINYVEDEGIMQPSYISSPIPMMLINGLTQIGTGKASHFDERDAREVINWIKEMVKKNDTTIEPPKKITTSGCIIDEINGYTRYTAVIRTDLDKKYDIITNLPPRVSDKAVKAKLAEKLKGVRILDGSGKGKPIWIMVQKGKLKEEDYIKLGLRTLRKEAYYIWDDEYKTVRNAKTLSSIAMSWLEKRREVVEKRINNEISKAEAQINKINLIKLYVEKEMNKWSTKQIEEFLGEKDANTVLSQTARAFLPENIDKNEITKKELNKTIKENKDRIANIYDVIFAEAFDIIEKQEEYFNNN